MSEAGLPIGIIGAGFSGTMTALHLIRGTRGRPVLLCERGPTFARGPAYSTEDPVHLLNVRASNMSAFPDRPDHFVDWLAANGDLPAGHRRHTDAGTFVSRAIYGRYLSALLQAELASSDGAARLRIVPEEVVALDRRPGGGFNLKLAGGRTHRIAGAVVAVGNLAVGSDDRAGRLVHDPWAVRFTEGLVEGRRVVVVGTGLTMVDVVTSLHDAGFGGPVLAISRRGQLPRTHVPPVTWRISRLDAPAGKPLSALLHAVRQEVREAAAAGTPWQSVVDALRPVTSSLWRGLTPGQQGRFLRHLRPWWDVHRHRMAPPIAERLRHFIAEGYLRVAAGQMRAAAESSDGVAVRWAPRGGRHEETVAAQCVIFATGSPSVGAAKASLLERMIRDDLARMDCLGLGLEATRHLEFVGRDGRPVPGLWGIGPIVRGSFWECTAVPDIRADAQRLAARILHQLGEQAV